MENREWTKPILTVLELTDDILLASTCTTECTAECGGDCYGYDPCQSV